jgi:NAD dependent epimerase/dehydratase family enzyme
MADMLLSSQNCSDGKILKTGYKFHFPELKGALENIYSS